MKKKTNSKIISILLISLFLILFFSFQVESRRLKTTKEDINPKGTGYNVYGIVYLEQNDKTSGIGFEVRCENLNTGYVVFNIVEYNPYTTVQKPFYSCDFPTTETPATGQTVEIKVINNGRYGNAVISDILLVPLTTGIGLYPNNNLTLYSHISIYSPNSTHYNSEYTFFNPIYNITNTTPNFTINYTLRDYTTEARISINNQPNITLCTNCINNQSQTFTTTLNITQDTQNHTLTIYAYNSTNWVQRTTFITTKIIKPDYQITNLEITPYQSKALTRGEKMTITTSYINKGEYKTQATLNIYKDTDLIHTTTINPELNTPEQYQIILPTNFTPAEPYTSEEHNITAEIIAVNDTNITNNKQTKTKTFFDTCIKRIIRGRNIGILCFV